MADRARSHTARHSTDRPWLQWLHSAFVRVRSTVRSSREAQKPCGLSAPERTGANVHPESASWRPSVRLRSRYAPRSNRAQTSFTTGFATSLRFRSPPLRSALSGGDWSATGPLGEDGRGNVGRPARELGPDRPRRRARTDGAPSSEEPAAVAPHGCAVTPAVARE